MIGIALAVAVVGLFLSAFFSGSETGFYRATRLRLVLDAMRGDKIARGLLFLTNHPALFVATSLVGNNVANYLISAATVLCVEAMFLESSHAAEIVTTLALAPLVLVYGELLPKSLFLQAPNRLLRAGGGLFLFFVVLFFPLAGALWMLGRLVGRMVGRSHEPVRLVIAQRELRRILAEGHEAGILHPAQQMLAHGILAVSRKPVGQFITPLAQIPRARANMSKPALLRLAEQMRMAVLPVASADATGRLIGCVRVIDLRLSDSSDIGPLRPLLEIRDDSTHLAALMRLESTGESLARVVDSRGETIGIVTLERLREPLF